VKTICPEPIKNLVLEGPFLLIYWLPGAIMVQLKGDLKNNNQKHQDFLF
jgi:hypothetical protein